MATPRTALSLPDHVTAAGSVPEYEIRGGLRYVKEYVYEFRTHAKGRWIGRSILDVFTSEFRMYPSEYYERAIELGNITLNGQQVTCGTPIKNHDFVVHRTLRNEAPVPASLPSVLADTEDLVVVSKPAGIPVHPTGMYHYNTVTSLLRECMGYAKIHGVHRLDKLTSGVLLFAKSSQVSARFERLLKSGGVHKEYLALVHGHFPLDGRIDGFDDDPSVESSPPDAVVVDVPLRTVAHNRGQCACTGESDPRGRPARTRFIGVSHHHVPASFFRAPARQHASAKPSDSQPISLVRCLPETGRQHQLRLHLVYLGFPIIGDPLYGTNGVFVANQAHPMYEPAGRYTEHTGASAAAQPKRARTVSEIAQPEESSQKRARTAGDHDVHSAPDTVAAGGEGSSNRGGDSAAAHTVTETSFEAEAKATTVMCLHALKYQGSEFLFEDKAPWWAELPV